MPGSGYDVYWPGIFYGFSPSQSHPQGTYRWVDHNTLKIAAARGIMNKESFDTIKSRNPPLG